MTHRPYNKDLFIFPSKGKIVLAERKFDEKVTLTFPKGHMDFFHPKALPKFMTKFMFVVKYSQMVGTDPVPV